MSAFALVVGVALLPVASEALAPRTYVVAVGNNALPLESDAGLRPLTFADDDAAAFFSFVSGLATEAHLLAVLDADTQRRYPELAAQSRPPTLVELREVVEHLAERVRVDRDAGTVAELYIFFSGHGSRSESGAFLALLDGALTRKILYDEILASIPARFVHLIVDACYAEAVVRPRDASAEVVELSDEDALDWIRQKSLRRFPNVGAVIAGAGDQTAHEWDIYEGGIFTHQVLSGLRGGADVNGDSIVEYGELRAFLAAANSGVTNSRARLQVVVRAPPLDLHTSLVNLGRFTNVGWAVGSIDFGHFYVERENGQRLLDMHAETGFPMRIAVPARTPLVLRTPAGELSFSLEPGAEILLSRMMLGTSGTAARGAIESALRRGLFLQPFGPRYFAGFADRKSSEVSLENVMAFEPPPSATAAWAAWAATGALAASSILFGILAADAKEDFQSTNIQRAAHLARNRYDRYRYTAMGTGVAALIGLGVGIWLFPWDED